MRRLFLLWVWFAASLGAWPVAADNRLTDFGGGGVDSVYTGNLPALRSAMQAVSSRHFGAAAAELKDILKRDPSHIQAMRLLAYAYSHLDADAQAIQVCRQISARDPADAGVEVALGYFHQKLGDFDAAQSHYRQALSRNPMSVHACLGLAWVHLQRRQFDQSLEMVKRVTEQAPGYAPVYILMGRVLTAQGFFADAAKAYRQAFALHPGLRTRYGILLQELSIRHPSAP